MLYTYSTIYENLKALGLVGVTSTMFSFEATYEIDLTAYQEAVMKLDFKGFQDEQFETGIDAAAAKPSVEQLLGISKEGSNSHIPGGGDANIIVNADRVVLNARKDFTMLFGQEGVAIASPTRVNIDSGRSITLFGHQNVFLGIPNKGNPIPKNTTPPVTKGDPTLDQEYDPLVLGLKLANLVQDICYVLKASELTSGVSPVRFQPHTQAEFGLISNRVPEILSNYAYLDGYSHSEINQEKLKELKAAQKAVENFKPPTQLTGSFTGTATGTPMVGGGNTVPAGLDFTPVPGNVTPTSKEYIIVEGGHGAYWPKGNPYARADHPKADPKIGAGDGDNLHSFTSDIDAHKGRSMDLQVETGLKEFKTKFGKPADIVGMVVEMNEKASSKQVAWKVLIQESKNGIHYSSFRARGSAKAPAGSLPSTMSQINAGMNIKNFKKVYLFTHDIGSLLITQAFAIY
jgi:hypothetical protein